jgi:tetratricopeptide (TPR) repeat protein
MTTNASPDGPVTGLFYEGLLQSYLEDPHFVERTWLAEQIAAAQADPKCRFLLLTAEPGAGKTAFMAWMAHLHPDWPRYFVRRDSRTPLSSGDTRSFLLSIGHQLAALHPGVFRSERLELVVQQRIDELAVGGRAVGLEVDDLLVSPFYQTALKVEQQVHLVAGELAGISVKRAVAEPRLLDVDNLQYLALLDPAAALLAEAPATRIVLLVDALDELRYHSSQANLLSWLASCPALPENLRIVLASRPDSVLDRFRRSQEEWLREFIIDSHSEAVNTDLHHYTFGFARHGEVSTALTAQGMGVDQFTRQLVAKAGGNFQYLAALFRAIRLAIELDDQTQLQNLITGAELPAGLQGLYAFFVASIKDGVADQTVEVSGQTSLDVRDQPAWEALYQPILGLLAVAHEPLTLEQLITLAAIRPERRWVMQALVRLRPFLDVEQQHYSLFHNTMPEFLTAPETQQNYPEFYQDPSEWHRRIVAAYRAGAASLAEVDWSHCDDYGLRHVPTHLTSLRSNARDRAELYGLLCESFMRAKQTRYGSHRPFADDVGLVLEVAQAIRPPDLVQTIRLGHLTATLRSLTTNMPSALMTALAAVGQADIARDYADLIPASGPRTGAYLAIGQALLIRNEFDVAREVLLEALRAAVDHIAEEMDEEYSATVLSQIAPALNRVDELEAVATATRTLWGEQIYHHALSLVAEDLALAGEADSADKVSRMALNAAGAIAADPELRDVTYHRIAHALALAGETEVALTLAEQIDQADIRIAALDDLVRALIGVNECDLALALIERPELRTHKVDHMQRLAERLGQLGERNRANEVAKQALATEQELRPVKQSDSRWDRLSALGKLAQLSIWADPGEARARQVDAVRAARKAAGSGWLAWALADMVESLGQFGEWNGPKNEALGDVAMALFHAGNFDALLTAAAEIKDPEQRAMAMSAVGTFMLKQGQYEAVLSASDRIRIPELERAALADKVVALGQAGDQEAALESAELIADEAYQNAVLAKLAVSLADRGEFDGALAIVDNIEFVDPFIEGASQVATALVEAGESELAADLVRDLLKEAETVVETAGLVIVLSRIARALHRVDHEAAASWAIGQALTLVGRAVESPEQVAALTSLSGALTSLNRSDEAAEIGRRALDLVSTVGIGDDRVEAKMLTALTEALAQAGDSSALMVAGMLGMVDRADYELEQFVAFGKLAQAAAGSGDIDQALQWIGQIEPEESALIAVSAVVEALPQADDPETAALLATRILELADHQLFGDSAEVMQGLAHAAIALTRLGHRDRAETLVKRALGLEESGYFERAQDKVEALCRIADALVYLDEQHQAVVVANRGLTIALESDFWLEGERARAEAACRAIEKLASLRQVDPALATWYEIWAWSLATSRGDALNILGRSASFLAGLDQGQSLADVVEEILTIEGWWDKSSLEKVN